MERSRGRYYTRRDVRLMNSFNGELLLNIIEQMVIIFKVNPYETEANVYGESPDKTYHPGVQTSCLVEPWNSKAVLCLSMKILLLNLQ